MMTRRLRELAEEAADCIETCGLKGKELEDYLASFMREVLDEAKTPPARSTKRLKRPR